MESRSSRNKRKRNKNTVFRNIYFQISVVVVIVFSAFLGYVLATKSFTDSWEDKIYPGVTVEGVDLSGKLSEEAVKILNENFSDKIGSKNINISVDGQAFNYTYSDVSAVYDIEACVEEALNYGKDKGIFAKNSLIKNKKNETHTLELGFSYDEEKLKAIKEEISNKVEVKPVNASISVSGGVIQVTPESTGYTLDSEDFEEKLKSSINSEVAGETNIEYTLKSEEASIKSADLSKITGKLSTFSTSYTVGDRGYNLELATSLVNGTILMPGETFSYSEVSQKGRGKYKDANGYINGKVEAVEAGGICQVSTTLYRAIMRANIRSVERYNHMMTVGYALPGLDATVAWGSLDYKFTNTYDFPIYIEGIGGRGTITFNIYGRASALGEYTYDLAAEDLGTDSAGYRRAKSYLVTYKNGVEVNREYIATDTYRPSTN